MQFTPLHDRVVVKPHRRRREDQGRSDHPRLRQGEAVRGRSHRRRRGRPQGLGRTDRDTVKAGDRILFGKWSGTEVKIDGEDLLIMKESDILGIITTGAAKAKAA